MSFFGFGKTKQKETDKNTLKVYSDLELKVAIKHRPVDVQTKVSDILSDLPNIPQNENLYKCFILLTCNKDKSIILQRKLETTESVLKVLNNKDANLDQYLVYQEFPIQKYLAFGQYRQESMTLQVINPDEQYYRCGTLLKKQKNGQFKERLFKLMKDCLIYQKVEKKNIVKSSYVSLDYMQIENSKDKNYIFQLTVDSKVYILKAQSKTDYDGWLYSIRNQCFKAKDVKLLTDSDKRIYQFQKQKVDNYKSIAGHSTTNKLQDIDQKKMNFQQKSENRTDQIILQLKQSLNQHQESISNSQLQTDNQLNHFEILEKFILPLPVKTFNAFLKFQLPDFSKFYSNDDDDSPVKRPTQQLEQ